MNAILTYVKKHKVPALEARLLRAVEGTFNEYASLAAEWDIEDEDDYDDLLHALHDDIKAGLAKRST